MTGRELRYIAEAHARGQLAGEGPYTKLCQAWLEERIGCARALLTHSCTAALEMTALLLGLGPADEFIVPSYTFVSTANAFVLRGATPVFVDVREDTLNLDERLVESAITPRTRAIVAVHYAGVACEMDSILQLAARHRVPVVEDAAHALSATYRGRALGGLGSLDAVSYHETKNVISGEGGCLLINDAELVDRAEMIREKGTDRSRFFRGEVGRYTWRELGSSYVPGELMAAFLWAQLEDADRILEERIALWSRYHGLLESLDSAGVLRRPTVPEGCRHSGHLYWIVLAPGIDRGRVIDRLRRDGIDALFHYVPLHSSPAGRRYGRTHGELQVTESIAARILRLPMWIGLTETHQATVVESLRRALL
jgi:dTDP-4-amino-4,6-dideoxygalactose transaminase